MTKLAHRLLAVGAAMLVATTGLAAATYQEKEADIQAASQKVLDLLTEHRTAGTLDDGVALAIIQEDISPQFDFDYLTRFVLGKNWRKLDDAQRARTATLFQQLIERTYSKTLSKFDDQEVSFLDSEQAKDGSVIVGLEIINKGKPVVIEYRIKDVDGSWTIADVKVENVSLLGNYRRQFNSIIRKDGPAGLIALLENRK